MTRQEAIKALRLERGIEINGNAVRVAEFLQGLDVAISALRAQQESGRSSKVVESNEPLTLDELRKMDGEPVYIVENTEYWSIVNGFDQKCVYLLSHGNPDDYGCFGLYGKTWLAYRQKPEEGTV